MALMYARLISPPQTFDEKIAAACERIVSAMTTYPELLVAALTGSTLR